MSYYYAFRNAHGMLRCIDEDGYRVGKMYRFATKAARDAWVCDNQHAPDYICREQLKSAEARQEMAHRVSVPTRGMSMDELWNAYCKENGGETL